MFHFDSTTVNKQFTPPNWYNITAAECTSANPCLLVLSLVSTWNEVHKATPGTDVICGRSNVTITTVSGVLRFPYVCFVALDQNGNLPEQFLCSHFSRRTIAKLFQFYRIGVLFSKPSALSTSIVPNLLSNRNQK